MSTGSICFNLFAPQKKKDDPEFSERTQVSSPVLKPLVDLPPINGINQRTRVISLTLPWLCFNLGIACRINCMNFTVFFCKIMCSNLRGYIYMKT